MGAHFRYIFGLAGLGWVCSTLYEKHIVSLLSRGGVWSNLVKMHLVSFFIWEGFILADFLVLVQMGWGSINAS